jgi:hypothetical protein
MHAPKRDSRPLAGGVLNRGGHVALVIIVRRTVRTVRTAQCGGILISVPCPAISLITRGQDWTQEQQSPQGDKGRSAHAYVQEDEDGSFMAMAITSGPSGFRTAATDIPTYLLPMLSGTTDPSRLMSNTVTSRNRHKESGDSNALSLQRAHPQCPRFEETTPSPFSR